MSKIIKALFLIFFILGPTQLTAQELSSNDIFLKLETDLMDAVVSRDRKTMERLFSDSFKLTSSDSSGAIMLKSGYISGSMNPDILTALSYEFKDFSIEEITPDVVIVKSLNS